MRSGSLTSGRNRKCSLAGRIRERVKRFLSVAVSVSVIACSMPTIPVMAATDDDDVQEFTMTVNDLCDAVEAALQADEPISESAYVFEGEAQETYEDLFYGADVYEIEPEYEKSSSNDLSLKMFVRLGNDREIDSTEITGEEEIVFLLLNRSDEEATARIMIDEYETGLITVAPKGDVEIGDIVTEEISVSTLSAPAEDESEDESDEIVSEDDEDTEAADTEDEVKAETEDDEDAVEAEADENDDPEAEEAEDKYTEDSKPEKSDDGKPDDKGKDHKNDRVDDSGENDTEKPGSNDKADKNDPKDKGDRGFTGGSHSKDDKADGNDGSADKADRNDSGDKADKTDNSDSKDAAEKDNDKGSGSAQASRSSRNSNPLKAALDDKDDANDDDEIETEVEEKSERKDREKTEAKAGRNKNGDIAEDKDADDNNEIQIVIDDEINIANDDDDIEIISDNEDEIAIEVYAADVETDDDDIDEDSEDDIASAAAAKIAKDSYTLIDGETYEPVVVNHSRGGVAYMTTLQQLGIDYGIMPLASASDAFKQAIEGSSGNETIELTEDITIDCSESSYVEVKAQDLTIDLGGNSITVSGTNKNYYLFNITSGGSVTIQNGKIDGKDSSDEASAVTAVYSGASGNDVTLDKITIENFGNSSNGTVYAAAGNLTVTNCTIQNNETNGIHADNCDDLVITSSIISGNTANNGGGIFIINHQKDLCIKDNIISENVATEDGGGIYIFLKPDSAKSDDFAITGNKIINNSVGYDGGGIYFITPTNVIASSDVSDFDLSGNTITGNKADTGYGGGIELMVDVKGREIVIKSGLIEGNSAYWGAGIDSSYSYCQSTLHLYNAVITGNEAGFRGGGIWACPTSETTMNVTYGAAIYENQALGNISMGVYGPSGDDIRFEGKDTDAADPADVGGYASVSKRALGGTLMDWYADDDSRGKRYETGDKPVDVSSERYTGYVESFGLHGGLSEEGISDAKDDALLYITNNTSRIVGGGVATNTPIIFGSDEDGTSLTVTANKVWIDEYGNEMSPEQTKDYSVDITLIQIDKYRNMEKELETITLNSENGWTWNFEELPTAYMTYDDGDYNEHSYTYTVKEGEVVADSDFEVKIESSGVTKDKDGKSSQTLTITNSKFKGLLIGKQVQGSGNISETFRFMITLTYPDGTPYEGDVNVSYYTNDPDSGITDKHSDILTFTNGETEVTLAANGYINLFLDIGMEWKVEEITVNNSETVNCETYVSLNGITTKAKAASGTFENSSQVIFINSYREYYDIDEEIIPGMDDALNRSSWEKNTSVTEYGALEFEMSTFLPKVTPNDIKYGEFTMLFHNKLDEGLLIDANEDEDLHITIGGKTVDPDYYTVDVLTRDTWTIAPLALVDNEDCTFHVTVDLSRLYNETDIVNDDDLAGNTEIIIYFYVDLEGRSMEGSYKSIVQYQIFDEDELLYTSSESTVYVYTYEIGINKASTVTGNGLAGATFGVYYDEACTQPVMRYGENYTVISDENGDVLFYGLAAGTYYLKELEAPDGYVLTTEIFKVIVGEEEVDISGPAALSDKELDGAVFEVYYDEDCTQPVRVDGVYYTVTSNADGTVTFDGIAAGTYYLKGVEDSEGNDISSIVIPVTLDYDTFTYGYEFTVGNDPTGSSSSGGSGRHSSGGGGSSSGASGSVVGGPATGDTGVSENYYPSDTMPQTGDPGATGSLLMMLFGFGALLLMTIVDRKKKETAD